MNKSKIGDKMSIEFKAVDEQDGDRLFNWANDNIVRKNSFSSEEISYETHKKWFLKNISSESVKIFIVIEDDEEIGQIRVDIRDDMGTIGYSVDKNFRGKGYGTKILIELVEFISELDIGIKLLSGKVKYSNLASQRAFEKAGYSREDLEDCIEYTKQV